MEQQTLFKENKYLLDKAEIKHCMKLQEKIENYFKINMRKNSFRIVAFHLSDNKKFIARIAGELYFCEMYNDKKIKWQRAYNGKGCQHYKWVEWVEGENNTKVDLLSMWCPGSDTRANYEKKKAYLENLFN